MSTTTASPLPTRAPHPVLLALALVVLSWIAYASVGQLGFVNLDDDAYVETNALVNHGLRPAAVVWAFTSSHSNNWHPLTSLSHMLDCDLFGVKPGPMHWENVGWHALNVLLVFAALRSLTGATWRPVLVAAAFAVHPLHVESVAWISERKDVLSACFFLLGLWAYAGYVRAPTWRRYVLVAAALVLALLAKPMAVTFPCVLLLLDFWPLRRWPQRTWRELAWEKAPLFGLVLVHSVITFVVQHTSGAANYGQRFDLATRVANAAVAYVRYLGKTLWPENLAAFYAHPGRWPLTVTFGATVLLVLVTLTAWWLRRTRPWLLFGWLWFLGTLVPVIGIVQVGAQSMADRYMYLPILGLLVLVVWQLAALAPPQPGARRLWFAAATVVLCALALATTRQTAAWTSSLTLYDHAISHGEDNATVRYLRAVALQSAGRPLPEVAAEYQRALDRQPDYVNALTQLAAIAIAQGRLPEARALVDRSIAFEPRNAALAANLGALLRRQSDLAGAIREFERALTLDPRLSSAHFELGSVFLDQGRRDEALRHYATRASLERWNPDALCDYGVLLANTAQAAAGLPYLERAVWIAPHHARARDNLAACRQILAARK